MKIPKGFHLADRGGLKFFMCDAINDKPGFLQVFTTRKGGKSLKQYKSLNTGAHTGDNANTVKTNIKSIEKALNVRFTSAANQVHGDHVVIIGLLKRKNSKMKKCWDVVELKDMPEIKADGIISCENNVAAGVRLADCAGTVIIDPVNRVAASIHSGWRGVANRIPGKAVKKMKKYFGSDPKNLIAAISPAIGPCCYEVGIKLYNQLQKQPVFSNIFIKRKGLIYMNLWAGVKNILIAGGLRPKNIHVCSICTSCNPDYFYSHRRDLGRTGRQMAIGAVLKERQNND